MTGWERVQRCWRIRHAKFLGNRRLWYTGWDRRCRWRRIATAEDRLRHLRLVGSYRGLTASEVRELVFWAWEMAEE